MVKSRVGLGGNVAVNWSALGPVTAVFGNDNKIVFAPRTDIAVYKVVNERKFCESFAKT